MCYGGEYSFAQVRNLQWIYLEDLKRLEADGIQTEHHFFPKASAPIVLFEGKNPRIINARFDMLAPPFAAKYSQVSFEKLIELKNSSAVDSQGNSISYPTWNARVESVHEKVTFAPAWNACRRAVIPVTSYYERPNEPDTPPEVKGKEFQVFLENRAWMGAIWEKIVFKGITLYSYAVVTMDSLGHKIRNDIHHLRMPTLLTDAEAEEWLDWSTGPDRAFELVHQFPEDQMRIQEKVRPKKPKGNPDQISLFGPSDG
jgi:putative SOS response-associated peptidase YedK